MLKLLIKECEWQDVSNFSRGLVSNLVEKNYWVDNFIPIKDEQWVPDFSNNIYWSISHKNNISFVWINNMPMWIDIEVYKERSKELLEIFDSENYRLLWWKNWKNFYIIWTWKEGIIKYKKITLDELDNIKFLWYEYCDIEINDIIFNKKLFYIYQNERYSVLNWTKWELIYSLTIN